METNDMSLSVTILSARTQARGTKRIKVKDKMISISYLLKYLVDIKSIRMFSFLPSNMVPILYVKENPLPFPRATTVAETAFCQYSYYSNSDKGNRMNDIKLNKKHTVIFERGIGTQHKI
jgi:hypothetical protein